METLLSLFNSRSSGEQVAIMIAAGVVLHWSGVQLGELLGMMMRG